MDKFPRQRGEVKRPMPDFDVRNSTTPLLVHDKPHKPDIAALKAALTTYNATSYTPARMNTMTYDDLIYACRTHSLAVTGL